MRGSKFLKKLIVPVAVLLAIASVFTLLSKNKVEDVLAEDNSIYNTDYYSQKYDDSIVFSVEQVYYNYADRSTPLTYTRGQNAQQLSNIRGYGPDSTENGKNVYGKANYFANYEGNALRTSKKIVRDNEYVMLDETASMNAWTNDGSAVSLNQGVMLTLGGYVFINGEYHTNSEEFGESFYSSRLKEIDITFKKNGNVVNDESGLRTYYSGADLYFDFVYFIDAKIENEAHYELEMTYQLHGRPSVTRNFDFYVLMKSSYNKLVEVNNFFYSTAPSLEYVDKTDDKNIAHINASNYPTLTYDYMHYDMSYLYECNDMITNVSVKYGFDEESGQYGLIVNKEINGIPVSQDFFAREANNSIVSFVFANIGEYIFSFNYVYYYNDDRLAVDNILVENQGMKIVGYSANYQKNGFASADMRRVEIVKNGTIVIPVDAVEESNIPEYNIQEELGYVYKFVDSATKSGSINKIESIDVSKIIKDNELPDNINNIFENVDNKYIKFLDLSKLNFVNTDQGGIWFELDNYYDLDNSYYIYSPISFKNYSNANDTYQIVNFSKQKTFVDYGYYFVKLSYKLDNNDSNSYSQYFAFKLSSPIANAKLYTTEGVTIPTEHNEENRLYNKYTNKNVYAVWNNPNTFESSQSAKLYYASEGNNIYQSKEAMLAYADGQVNIALTSKDFFKDTNIITENGAYLLKVSINGTQRESFTYFIIDKEGISGIEVLGVSSAQIGTNIVYEVAKDNYNNPITWTDKALIDKTFTLWWNDKSSGAEISANYTFTPILRDDNNDEELSRTENGNNYLWLTTKYALSNTSRILTMEKPSTKHSIVNAKYALSQQGIYWFTLTDSAGNSVSYMTIVDKTEINIKASSQNSLTINSGDMLAEPVSFEWGTHKAIKLNNEIKDVSNIETEDNAWAKIYREFVLGANSEQYYKGVNSNLENVNSIVRTISDTNGETMYFVVPNNYATISSYFGEYRIDSDGKISSTGSNWSVIKVNNSHNITIGLTTQENSYTLKVFGQNQMSNNDSDSYFAIILNPDKSEGVVKSKLDQNSTEDYIKVYSYNDVYNESNFNNNYLTGQATDDGILVFEWISGQGSDFEVGSVYYDYYPLMTQSELNNYTQNNDEFKFYPYSANSTRYYIYGGDQHAQNYIVTNSNGKIVCRSNVLNIGNVSYYDEWGNLVSNQECTLPGMYVVTREYKNNINLDTDGKIRKYVFFVDRNNIIDYNTQNISLKTVGEYIGVLAHEKVNFKNFTQAIDTIDMYQGEVKVSANVYMETNRLPLQFRVPTGKYASMVNNSIVKTSNSLSAGLRFNIYFVDKYNYLGMGANLSFKLFAMEDMAKQGNSYITNGYIAYNLTPEILYQGDNSHSARYLKACVETGKDWLSLPGGYVIEILDNVGRQNSDKNAYKLEDCNKFWIGLNIYQQKPTVDLYASQNTNQSGNVEYAEFDQFNTKFASSKAFIRYELPFENENSLNAQIDKNYILITRIFNGVEEVYYSSATNSGLINRDTQFVYEGTPIKFIQETDDKIIVWLNTGLEIEDGKIVDYREYVYNIKVRYVLSNNSIFLNSYQYNQLNAEGDIQNLLEYYENQFTVVIDRTAGLENLISILNKNAGQEEFIESYLEYFADDEFEVKGKLDSKIYNTVAYRGPDGEDNYAIVNQLYYYYVDKGDYQSAQNAMYALKVDGEDKIDLTNRIYYRKLFINSENKNNRMALLPICDTYFQNTIGFATFSSISISAFSLVISTSSNNTWKGVFGSFGAGYYEIIEIDPCGNYTQYIIYFNNSNNLAEIANDTNPKLIFEDVASK